MFIPCEKKNDWMASMMSLPRPVARWKILWKNFASGEKTLATRVNLWKSSVPTRLLLSKTRFRVTAVWRLEILLLGRGLSKDSVHRAIHEHFHMKKLVQDGAETFFSDTETGKSAQPFGAFGSLWQKSRDYDRAACVWWWNYDLVLWFTKQAQVNWMAL